MRGSQALDQGCDTSLLLSSELHPGGCKSEVRAALGSEEQEGAVSTIGETRGAAESMLRGWGQQPENSQVAPVILGCTGVTPARGGPRGRRVGAHLSAEAEVHLSAEVVVHQSAEVVVHVSAEVDATDGEGSGRSLEVSAGSGEGVKWMCAPRSRHGPLLTLCSLSSGERAYQAFDLPLAEK